MNDCSPNVSCTTNDDCSNEDETCYDNISCTYHAKDTENYLASGGTATGDDLYGTELDEEDDDDDFVPVWESSSSFSLKIVLLKYSLGWCYVGVCVLAFCFSLVD